MISENEIFPIGQIVKPHGVNGELSFTFTTDVFDEEKTAFFILEVNGIYVPFFIESYRFKSNSTGLLKLEDINNEIQAKALSGTTIYLPKTYLDKVESTDVELDYFVGFEIVDANAGSIGAITEVDQTTENALFVIGYGEDEMLIPIGEDYIVEIDHDNKVLYVSLPDGLLEL